VPRLACAGRDTRADPNVEDIARAAATRGLLKASGATMLVEKFGSYDHFSSAHVFGNWRIGNDARVSVVEVRLCLHGFQSLRTAI
jgi:hypothetical protein